MKTCHACEVNRHEDCRGGKDGCYCYEERHYNGTCDWCKADYISIPSSGGTDWEVVKPCECKL